MTMTNRNEVDPSIPTAAELRRDVLNRPAPDFGGFHEDEGGPDDYTDVVHDFVPSNRPGFEHTCSSCGLLADDEEHDQAALDHAFADSDDGVLARHAFDLGGES